MSQMTKTVFLHFLPKMLMMHRTKYILPDYDDNAPSHGYMNGMDSRDSISDFTSDYKIDGDNNFESAASNMHHHSGKIMFLKLSIFFLIFF